MNVKTYWGGGWARRIEVHHVYIYFFVSCGKAVKWAFGDTKLGK